MAVIAVVEFLRPVQRANGKCGFQPALALFDTRDKSWFDLPHSPLHDGRHSDSQFISTNGKIYVLGGLMNRFTNMGSRKVYVLDTFKPDWQWEPCASMRHGRIHFGVGVMHGKLYVFGGQNRFASVYSSEVYNPEANIWSSIEDISQSRIKHQVAAAGAGLYVYGGYPIPEWLDAAAILKCTEANAKESVDLTPEVLRYSSWYDRWVSIPVSMGPRDRPGEMGGWDSNVFISQGRFYGLKGHKIYVYNFSTNCWVRWHSLTFFSDGLTSTDIQFTGPAIQLGDELLIMCTMSTTTPDDPRARRDCLVQTKGFGGEVYHIGVEVDKKSLERFRFGKRYTRFCPLDR